MATTFLPTGPLHMLPPAVLDALKLSTKECNEVLTVALSVDYETGAHRALFTILFKYTACHLKWQFYSILIITMLYTRVLFHILFTFLYCFIPLFDKGEILSYRVFPSILGPVFPLDLSTANELIAGVGVDSSEHGSMDVLEDEYCSDESQSASSGVGVGVGVGVEKNGDCTNHNSDQRKLQIPCSAAPITTTAVFASNSLPSNSFVPYIARDFGSEWSARAGIPTNVTRDLRVLHHLTAKMCTRYAWLAQPAPKHGKQFVGFATPRTSAIREKISSAYSHRLINTLLTLYSQLSVQFCEDKGLSVPVAYSNRDRCAYTKFGITL